ncbi:sigma-70 family RNA polymerase sigma factor [Halosquirtibacter laminarini]|uniref:Sigma-70 family RNA polymerase sigma factor n=1 Tax=Halosquirtibacter laminarini TaxID=3374600 RepID=A0AC61NHM1_9BACT|nr:sigma-70 family RNA polymerase sigma factor [Prolixibacteraceae bacterium]
MNQNNLISDQCLVKKYLEGDNYALDVLITRHKNRIFTYIVMVVKSQSLAEDILQDTFIKVIHSLKNGKYKDNGKFISWVIRIAHNLIIDHFRKEKHLNVVSNDNCEVDLFNNTQFSDTNIETQIINDRVIHEVGEIMNLLPEDQKEIIRLRHYYGLSFKEIAEQTNVSINTALGRMRYALINMRKIVDEKNLELSLS